MRPELLSFRRREGGKPEIDGPAAQRGVEFNLSHTDGLLACATTAHRRAALGIDVETVDGSARWLLASPRVLSVSERDRLGREACPRHREERFLAFWTLKEAYAKACGEGLRMDFSRLSFRLAARLTGLHAPAAVGQHWQFFRAQPTQRHRMALAIRTPAPASLSVRVRWLGDADLDL